jgi:ketopantoate reductase
MNYSRAEMWSFFHVNRGLWTPLRPQLFTFYQWHPTHVHVTPHSQRCKSSKSSKSQKLPPLTKDDKTRIYTIGAGSKERFLAWALSNNTPLAPFTFILWRHYRFEQFVKNGKKITVIEQDKRHEVSGLDAEYVSRTTGEVLSTRLAADASTISMEDLPPIMNLMVTIPSDYVVEYLLRLRRRLRRDSTVLLVQEGSMRNLTYPLLFEMTISFLYSPYAGGINTLSMSILEETTCILIVSLLVGVLEQVYKDVFPDPKTRPNFFIGMMDHKLWDVESRNKNQPTAHNNNLKDMMNYDTMKQHKASTFTTFWQTETRSDYDHPGHVIFGPLAVESEKESKVEIQNREISSSYLVGQLRQAVPLGAQQRSQVFLTKCRLRRLATNAVLGALGALMKCPFKDILSGETNRLLARVLVQEMVPILQTVSLLYSFEKVWDWIEQDARARDATIPAMLNDILLGRANEIDWQNGWLIRRGQEVYPRISCPKHEVIVRLIKEEASRCKKKIEEIKVKRKAEQERRYMERREELQPYAGLACDSTLPSNTKKNTLY